VATLIAALSGSFAIVLTGLIGAYSLRVVENRKHLARLTAEALTDMMHAFSANSEALGHLKEAAYEPDALAGVGAPVSDEERFFWRQQLGESRVSLISAKARLTTFGSCKAVEAAVAALGDDFRGSEAGDQRALAHLVTVIRHEMMPRDKAVLEESIIQMFFGLDAAALHPPAMASEMAGSREISD
jgi:hypothetical protein